MSEINTEPSIADSAVILSETSSTAVLPSSSPSPSNTVDNETKRRKILSKLWGKGNKLSHKVRELEKSIISNSSDSSIHNDNDQQQLADNSNNLSSYSSTNDPKSTTEDSSNSINSSKPLAVVKPIVVVKSGLIVSSAADRTRVNSEASSTTITQTDETTTTTTTVTERQSLSTTTTTDKTSNKKKKSHKKEDSKKKKTTKDKSKERDRSKDRHHHQKDENSNKKNSSSSKTHRREHNEEISVNDNQHKSSRYHSSSTTSLSNNRRRSPSVDADHSNRKSSRSTTSRKDEPSSSKRSPLSPVDHHHRHTSSKYETTSHRHGRGSSRTHSPSPSRSRHSTTNRDRSQTKNSSSPKKDDRNSATTTKPNRQQTESVSNSKSTNSISLSDSSSKHRRYGSDTAVDNDTQRHKTRTSDENLTNSSKSQKSHEISPDHRPSKSSIKQEKSKTITNNDENSLNQRKLSSSRHDRRSHSRHRSRSKEDKTNRKIIEPSNSDESSINKTKINHEKNSTKAHENSTTDKKSSRGSSIPSTNDEHRRKSSSDHHRYDRHDSPSNYDRRKDDDYYYHDHRHSYYPNTHYVHHHHHHHYRSTSSRYHYHRRSISPRSHQHRSRYFSSTSSSLSPSPRRRSPSRSSSSSSRSSSSYSSISRTSSSRSSSRNNHYYHHHHHDKKFRRSPTLEKLFLKASESIESVSTQKNPNKSSSTHLMSIQTSNTNSDLQITSPMNSLSETNTFYSESFSGFSVPPPPFISQPQQRCLKEITTDSSTSRRLMFNEIPSSTSSNIDEVIPSKTIQSNDLSNNVRSGSNKPPRISRFSDITPSITSDPPLNTNLSVDTPLDYTQISENINCLPSSRRQQKRHNREVMECECTTSEYDRSRGIKACGHECLNRMLLIECSSICPCGQWCTNRRFQRRSHANHKLALFKTEMKGYGLRTTSSIHKSRFLVEYIGEVIDMDELARRNKKYKRDGNIHQYVMSLIHGTVIDSTIKGNWARFINHSCEPNCVAEKWLVNGEYRMGIFAKRDLDINEEITIDYRFETFGAVDLANEKCYCGAPTCRGTISVKSNNNNNNNLNKRQNRRQPIDDDELLDYLHDDETNEYIIPKTIDEIRQLIQIMSRTDSENVRTIELDLIKNSSQKHFELPRLFLECNGLHVLCSWMKDILINNDDEQQQYSDEFKYHLLDFIHIVLPIKDRTTVIKNGLLELVYKKLKLPLSIKDNLENNNQEQIKNLMNSMLNHLDDPIISKLFHIYSTWMSLKERYIIPKRKESQETLNHHHHRHHHHHSSKYPYEENNYRLNFSTRSSIIQQKPIERFPLKRSFIVRDIPRTQEQQLSKDERRKLFEQQYEDEEKAKAAAAAAAANGESPGGQNEPPHKKQRTSDGTEPTNSNTPSQSQDLSMSYAHQTDQTYWIHKHLSQIPIDYIHSYMNSIGQPISVSSASTGKDEPPLPPPPLPDDENELSRIIRLPSGWSVAMCPSDSSVYFYNQQTMTTSWTPPSLGTPTENSGATIDLSPISSAQITEQHHPHHHQQQISSSSRSALKLSKYPHRHSRNHRHHYHHHHHMSSNNKRKRPSEIESTTGIKEEPHPQSTEETTSMIILNEQIKQEETNDKKPVEHTDEMSSAISKASIDENNEFDMSTTVKESSEINDNIDESTSSNNNTLSSSLKVNRDLLRKNLSQHVHTTLKPYTKRTCKQGRIVSTDDIKYLVKKFTLAVLDKEIEKAKTDGIPLSPILTDRVRLKTEVYVKKYMNKMGSVFQRHDTTVHHSSQPTATTTTNAE